jgi:hypothetical protein
MAGEIVLDEKTEEGVLGEERRPLGNLEGKVGYLLKKYPLFSKYDFMEMVWS